MFAQLDHLLLLLGYFLEHGFILDLHDDLLILGDLGDLTDADHLSLQINLLPLEFLQLGSQFAVLSVVNCLDYSELVFLVVSLDFGCESTDEFTLPGANQADCSCGLVDVDVVAVDALPVCPVGFAELIHNVKE